MKKHKLIGSNPFVDGDAQHDDSQWFAERINRTHRMRTMHKSECARFGGDTHMIVQRVDTSTRFRRSFTPVGLPVEYLGMLTSDKPLDLMCDLVLDGLFTALARGRAFQIKTVVLAAIAKAKSISG